MTSGKENYLYRECGLEGITLMGVDVHRCGNCGEHEVSIQKIQELHRSIAESVGRKVGALTHEEMRFVRKYLGFSGAAFATFAGVAPETVSRWETGKNAIPIVIERLLRSLVQSGFRLEEHAPKAKERTKAVPFRVKLAVRSGKWSEAAGAA
jgi:putative zinc finger/helix-turn-helix YgiT family protein